MGSVGRTEPVVHEKKYKTGKELALFIHSYLAELDSIMKRTSNSNYAAEMGKTRREQS